MQYSIQEFLNEGAYKLNKVGIKSSQLETRILLQHAINKPHEYLVANPEKQLNQLEIETFEKALERRLKHEPIAYILGTKEFYSHEFIVNKHVLIPRSDTELLVEVCIKSSLRATARSVAISRILPEIASSTPIVSSRNDEYTRILELGTGSGCIAISLLLELPNSQVTATDISFDAIEVARSNAVKHNVADRLKIIHSNWFENVEKRKFDLIISNPPYISETEKSEMAIETINYEPYIALFAEEDGLQGYRIIAENAKKFLKQNGKIILELGYKQAKQVSQIFLDHGYIIDNIHQDLQSHNRVIEISLIQLNRSYARRIGKSLSGIQQNLLDNELPKYLFSKEKLIGENYNSCKIKSNYTKFNLEKSKESVSRGAERIKIREHLRTYKEDVANFSSSTSIFLEIGFGMGEHFINQAKMNPDKLFIGVEVYLNGVANVLKLAEEQNITNFLLFPNNLDFILHDLPDNRLDGIYILFPDPWIKNRQKKKRILNKERLTILQTKLKNKGSLIFASDIENYFEEVVELIKQNGNFQITNEDNYAKPHDNYIITKYHQKAINESRTPQFLKAIFSNVISINNKKY
ncbi:bifunctional peptide chain release factor N(5)-glutamine methyltransferase PrmC/tRNA (guanosine(46)-N7)-methyltransferase TrmB [Rickettsia endosymbiont of Pantilius tunicatus]|uniref:bifunctional peptide chain release factor N(5)-glutamine methyltransferase PrmC/tRNA (guanosine(46)-N7)-methyltransferase TrmB n=1 Tax=Rickettsia endosymbiont of Pantilius tunicatus TaxID=3066267 RepID=UPI0030E43817